MNINISLKNGKSNFLLKNMKVNFLMKSEPIPMFEDFVNMDKFETTGVTVIADFS